MARRLYSVVTDKGELPCDSADLSLGIWTGHVAKSVGIHLPIWPVQGYSMTVPATDFTPSASITDTSRKTVFCRIGDRLRIAGLADIAPGEGVFKSERFETLFKTARGIFPKAGDYDGEVNAWTGWRPVTPNSQPIVGRSKVDGLFLNCGHGSLGWTLSMATAQKWQPILRTLPICLGDQRFIFLCFFGHHPVRIQLLDCR
ncbi:FAD-dependent oxidoreductase [Mesorhizobium sp. M0317]|uniref:FAD-dependent oxidoreductase n=1 Tax=Mesorhizobium sp. M0317 TaxID=2956935 RepID=UPI00333DD61F